MVVKFFILYVFSFNLFATNLHYSLDKKETGSGSTLLIIGGIHGNEPGGYFAPTLFLKHYAIQKGNVWVVPNLNFDSIVQNQRGIYGDMNRKFERIDADDKDFQIVADIKKLILLPQVDLILNLHDGHGFYREKAINGLLNPKAWGQTCIIDQNSMPNAKFGNLQEIAKNVSKETNILLREDVHEFNVKNTNTKEQDVAMRQSLTYFAIQHNKPAFAIETSKNIKDLAVKVFYQLKTIEEFMNTMGIKYSKDFSLSVEDVRRLLLDDGAIELFEGKVSLKLSDLRPNLQYFPIDKSGLKYTSDNPLVAVIKDNKDYKVFSGNAPRTSLSFELYDFDNSLNEVEFRIDGALNGVRLGSKVSVKKEFEILPNDGYRVNIIGFSKEGLKNESGIKVTPKEIDKKYSIDKGGRIFRVEFYKEKKFCGMVLVEL